MNSKVVESPKAAGAERDDEGATAAGGKTDPQQPKPGIPGRMTHIGLTDKDGIDHIIPFETFLGVIDGSLPIDTLSAPIMRTIVSEWYGYIVGVSPP